MASFKTGSAIVPSTSSISVVSVVAGSVCSGIVACGAITAGVGLGTGISLSNPVCGYTVTHRARLTVIAVVMAIRFFHSGSSSHAKRAPALLVRQKDERSFSSFCSSIESLHASSKPAVKLSREVCSVIKFWASMIRTKKNLLPCGIMRGGS